ncbi:MAG: hypothetical protein Q9195_007358 [Heterodermia aff. obscurata]
MLVSAVYFPVADTCRYQHWSHSGEHEAINPHFSNGFFLATLKEASSENDLVALENELKAHEILLIRDNNHLCIDQDWITDGRSWCALSNSTDSSAGYTEFWRDLLAMFWQMPHRDVHPIAERYRELFYIHAHMAIMEIFNTGQIRELDDATKALFCHVGLQVLSHRYQDEDFKLMKYLQRLVERDLPEIPRFQGEQYLVVLGHQHMGAGVTMRLAELRMGVEQYEHSKEQLDAFQPLLRNTEMFLSKAVDAPNPFDHRAWGMIGYALVELMNFIEVLQERDTFERITRVTETWRDKAMASGSAIEMAALCYVLVRLRAFDRLYMLPEEHYLSCGYYLARAGYLSIAEIFISTGIQYYERWLPQVPMWRYQLELCGVKMRLGQWEETTRELSSKWNSFDVVKNDKIGSPFQKNKSGEYGEYRLNLAFLLADCYIATDRVSDAMDTISAALLPVTSMRDSFIRSICVALRVRKLGLQLQLKDMNSASMTAVDLCRDLQDPVPLAAGPQTSFWTVQEILACVNELIHAEHHDEAYFVLRKLTGRTTGEVPDEVPDQRAQNFTASLPKDLKDYAYQRWSEISPMVELRRLNKSAATSLDIVSTSIDPTMTSVEVNQVPLTSREESAQVRAMSPKSSEPQNDVGEMQPTSLEATDTPQGTPTQSSGPLTIRATAPSTLPAAEIQSAQADRQQVLRAGVGDFSQRRRNLRNLMMLARLRKPPRTSPSERVVESHEPESSVHLRTPEVPLQELPG